MKKTKAEEEHLKAEKERRMRADQQRREEREREWERGAETSAAEMLVEFAEQIEKQETWTKELMMKDVCVQTDDTAPSIEILKEENESLEKQEWFGVDKIQGNDQMWKLQAYQRGVYFYTFSTFWHKTWPFQVHYAFLKGPFPINLLKHKNDKGTANIDKILSVCASLTNLCEPIV